MSGQSSGTSRPPDARAVVLILAATEWISTARMAMALHETGCRVELVGPRTHPALSTQAVSRRYPFRPLAPLRSLRRAIERSGASVLIPADEIMVLHLEELWHAEPEGSALRALLLRSMGGALVMSSARSRMALLRMAKEQGADIAETMAVGAADELSVAVEHMSLPVVLKADATFGGRGVRVLTDASEGRGAWRSLHRPPGLARAVSRGLRRKEWTHLRTWARRETRGVTAQKFVRGQERTAMVVCREGEVLGCVCLEVVKTWFARGPSSVLRVVEDEAMTTTIERVARALGVSGMCGFDFMIEEGSGRRLLIEMNSRPTQLVHLALGPGRDLIAVYVREVAGMREAGDRPAATDNSLIALFPQELQRDANSELLGEAYHDVPWNEPGLMATALSKVPAAVALDERWRARK